jgi:hypothetical protein
MVRFQYSLFIIRYFLKPSWEAFLPNVTLVSQKEDNTKLPQLADGSSQT